jgi:hypothetical protein
MAIFHITAARTEMTILLPGDHLMRRYWIPACAGMTEVSSRALYIPSSRRKPESRTAILSL